MKKFAVFGNPIAHSLSPEIHQMFGKSVGIDLSYEKRQVEAGQFKCAVNAFFEEPGAEGCNVTVPFKQEAFELADQTDKAATLAGAVNTLQKQGSKLLGYNTDGLGLVNDLLSCGIALDTKHVLLLGAGGAARGVIHPLLEAGVSHITILNRTRETAEKLVETINDRRVAVYAPGQYNNKAADIIVNSTSASLHGNVPDGVNEHVLRNTGTAYDMVYGKQPTAFMQYAERCGVPVRVDGLGMLVEQAASAFYLWTGYKPQTESVKKALREKIKRH